MVYLAAGRFRVRYVRGCVIPAHRHLGSQPDVLQWAAEYGPLHAGVDGQIYIGDAVLPRVVWLLRLRLVIHRLLPSFIPAATAATVPPKKTEETRETEMAMAEERRRGEAEEF